MIRKQIDQRQYCRATSCAHMLGSFLNNSQSHRMKNGEDTNFSSQQLPSHPKNPILGYLSTGSRHPRRADILLILMPS